MAKRLNRLLSFGVLLCLGLACSPRDGEAPSTRVSLKANGEKLPTCSSASDPTWSTLRLHREFEPMFSNIGRLRIIVGKGSRNCVPVSLQSPIEVEIAVAEGEFRRTGTFYLVTELVLLDTRDFLADAQLLQQGAEGMGLSPAQLIEILNSSPRRDQVTLTYLRPANSGAGAPAQGGVLENLDQAGQKLSTCQKESDPTWDTIRLFHEMGAIYPHLRDLRQILSKGGRNCTPVGPGPVTLQTQASAGGGFVSSGVQVQVVRIERLGLESFLQDTSRLQEVATQMKWTVQGLVEFLNQPPVMPEITISTVKPFVDGPAPPGSPQPEEPTKPQVPQQQGDLILRSPQDNGKTLSPCSELSSSLQLPAVYPVKAWLALQQQKARLIIVKGETSCLPVGTQIQIVPPGELEPLSGQLKAVIRRSAGQLLQDVLLVLYLAEDMGLEEVELRAYLEGPSQQTLILTEILWGTQP